ncbi:unnamed protein product [Vicia faba]|uniref:Uncharacterized protein n=1 Tax=Vicia faba TaxID=3906 RepID=A0AAV0YE55_VICFA|nr:unnamed protein product [Vicia faba]
MYEISTPSPELIAHRLSLIEEFRYDASSNTCHWPYYFLLTTKIDGLWSRDRLESGFLYCEKINRILNFNLPLILAVTITDRNLTIFLVDDRSSGNILYVDTLKLLGIQQAYLNPYNIGDLLAFNESMTHPQGTIDMTLAIG